MKKVGLLAALSALICGIAVYLYFGSVEQRIALAQEEREIPLTPVIVAAQTIPPYTVITGEMLRYEDYPAAYVNKQALTSPNEVLGLMSDGTIAEGQLILADNVGTAAELDASLSYRVPDGMRAMTVELELGSGVGGQIAEGDLIDLMLYLPVQGDQYRRTELSTRSGEGYETASSISTIVLEAAQVLKLGDVNYEGPSVNGLYSCVTLALSPGDCLTLFTAMKQAESGGGALYATLRQKDDSSSTDTAFYAVDELLNR